MVLCFKNRYFLSVRIGFGLLFCLTFSGLVSGEKYYVNKEYILKAKSYPASEDRVGILYPGDRVELIYLQENLEAKKKEDEFIAEVSFGGKLGFIPFKFLQKKKPPISVKIKKRAFIEPKIYYVKSLNLPVRLEPSTESLPIFSLPQNAEIIVNRFTDSDELLDGIPGRWAFFRQGRFEGWVFSGGISETKQEKEPEEVIRITIGKTYFINNDSVKLQNEPGNLGTPLAIFLRGEKVEVLEKKRSLETENGFKASWLFVKQDDLEGWVLASNLSEKLVEKPSIVPQVTKKSFSYPLEFERSKMTSAFGFRIDPVTGKQGIRHTGVDLYPFSRYGAPIFAAGDGIIILQNNDSGYGNLTVVQHSNGLVTYYAHQQKFLVRQNEKVRAGDLIGEVGSSGKSTGPHLHFEVRTGLWKEQLDPEKYIRVPGK